jgi:hypothetical protein
MSTEVTRGRRFSRRAKESFLLAVAMGVSLFGQLAILPTKFVGPIPANIWRSHANR